MCPIHAHRRSGRRASHGGTAIATLFHSARSAAAAAIRLSLPIVALAVVSCSTGIYRGDHPFRFGLMGNTNPDSPFQQPDKRVRQIVDALNRDNPVFVVHLGNLVFGGKDWMGFSAKDVRDQYRHHRNQIKFLRPVLFTVKGELDTFNDSSEIYTAFTRRPRYYSFNNGGIHGIVLDTGDGKAGAIDPNQMKWLEAELARYRDGTGIIVFTHHPLVVPGKNSAPSGVTLSGDGERLHELFRTYPVKAVFSTSRATALQGHRDGILYCIAACGVTVSTPWQKGAITYYLVDYFNGSCSVYQKRIQ